jgi:octaheme c-type cytochrome (tetrathionate reductase family)
MWLKSIVALVVFAGVVGAAFALVPAWHSSGGAASLHVIRSLPHTDHSKLISGPFKDGPSVTRACLKCHPNSSREVMHTSHWSWAGQRVKLPGRDGSERIGKANLINNFCIHAGPNIEKCSSCHAGYGWHDNSFFKNAKAEDVDCLACHEQTGAYQKGLAGNPEPGVDLVAAARSVGRPTRKNCGECHFKGGGGDAVKHGDLDGTMFFPKERIDVHMGRGDLQCVDCHRASEHVIPGSSMSVSTERRERVFCTECHGSRPHRDDRLDSHTATVACQTCHIPWMAIDAPTKMYWDWSTAGQDLPENPHVYLKAKGSFQYAQHVRPEYGWYNGRAYRYLTGEKIDPNKVVAINRPLGGPGDPEARIWPFKVHRGKQIYDKQHLYLLTPQTWGKGGYWTEFNWDKACRLGSEATGLAYSGEYGFVETTMHWPLSHMVQAKEKSLQCKDCHGGAGLMNWTALGYDGDPAFRGDRRRNELLRGSQGESR